MPTKIKPESEPISNAVEILLRHQRKGKMLGDLTDAMRQVVLAVEEHGKPGKLVLTFTVEPASGEAGALKVTDEITTKLPQTKKPSSLFYMTDDGRLVREDPNQGEMQLTVSETQEPDRKTQAAGN